jgi:hypothetical protein
MTPTPSTPARTATIRRRRTNPAPPAFQRGAREQSTHQLAVVGLQMQRHVCGHPEFQADLVGRPGLLDVPRDTIQDVPGSGYLGRDKRLPNHVEDNLVRHQLAAFETLLNGSTQLGLTRYVIAEQIAGRHVRNVEMSCDQVALRTLARTGGRNHQYPHVGLLTLECERSVHSPSEARSRRGLDAERATPGTATPLGCRWQTSVALIQSPDRKRSAVYGASWLRSQIKPERKIPERRGPVVGYLLLAADHFLNVRNPSRTARQRAVFSGFLLHFRQRSRASAVCAAL